MNIFFYASAQSAEAEQLVKLLLTKEVLRSLTVLPAGEGLNSDHSLKLRNGDVMILFAATERELETLLAMHDKFEEFRVILILGNHTPKFVANSHILKPRYITSANNDIVNLEKVISKMQTHTGGTSLYD